MGQLKRIFKSAVTWAMIMAIAVYGSWGRIEAADAKTEVSVMVDFEPVSLNYCVRFAVNNSFEVKLAKLDLYITETGLMYSEAVFDMFLFGGKSYDQDKRQQVSRFLSDYNYINIWNAGVENRLPVGTDITIELDDNRQRMWTTLMPIEFAHTAQLTLTAVQPLGKNAFGFVDRTEVTLAQLAIENASLEMKDKIEGVIARVEKAYWDFVFAKRALEIYEGMLERAEKLYETDKKNFDMGLVEKVDLLASQSNVVTTEAEVIIVANSYRRAEEDLKLIMNMDEARRIVPTEDLTPSLMKKSLPDCLKTAFAKRRDYKMKKRDVEMEGLEVAIKQNMQWPEIDITASMAKNGIDPDFKKAASQITEKDHVDYYIGVEMKVSLENKEAKSEYMKATYEKGKTIVNLKEVERNIITEVGNAFRDVVAYEISIAYMQNAVDLEDEKLKEEVKRFMRGRSYTKMVVDYQRDLLLAQLENARFLLKHVVAAVELARRMNVILESYEGVI